MKMNMADFFSSFGKRYGDKIAVVYGNDRITFSMMTERVNRLVNGLLDLGIKNNDPVALIANNCSQFLEIFFARYILGAVEISLNTKLHPNQWAHQINQTKANTIFVSEDLVEGLSSIRAEIKGVKNFIAISGSPPDMIEYENLIAFSTPKKIEIESEISENVLRRIVYTGGTTGIPKGVMLSRTADMAQLRNILIDLVPDLSCQDVFLGIQPMYHAVRPFFFPCWMRGVTQVIISEFHPEPIFDAIENENVTVIKTVPTVISRLISYPKIQIRSLKSIRTIIYGGSPMPVEKLKEAINIFGPIFIQNYGQTESAMTVCFLEKSDHLVGNDQKKIERLSSIGRPYSWVEVKIVDAKGKEVPIGEKGELIVRGDHNMMGYFKLPEETKQSLKDDWIYTRDIAMKDAKGYIYLVDRKSDMIITGGENVYPSEVEKILYLHKAVNEACVFGVPDENWGELVTAAVCLKPGLKATETEIIDFCKQHLAGYKCPKKIKFFNSLPSSNEGKILRRKLRSDYWKKHTKKN